MRLSLKTITATLTAALLITGLPIGFAQAESATEISPQAADAASAADLEFLHDWLKNQHAQGEIAGFDWVDLDDDGLAEALAVTDADDDGWLQWRLYAAHPAGPRMLAWDAAQSVSLRQPDSETGATAAVISDGTTWQMPGGLIRPLGGQVEKYARMASTPLPAETAFLNHYGYSGIDRGKIWIYRLNFIEGPGRDRVIVMKDNRYARADGSWPYLILDDYNRILLSGRSADEPFIFTDEIRGPRVIEIRDGVAHHREITVEKMK